MAKMIFGNMCCVSCLSSTYPVFNDLIFSWNTVLENWVWIFFFLIEWTQQYFQIFQMVLLQKLQCDFCRFHVLWEQVNNEMWSFCFLNDSKNCSELFILFHLPRDTFLWLMQLLKEKRIDPILNFWNKNWKERQRAAKKAERRHCDNTGWLLHFSYIDAISTYCTVILN